MPSRDKPGGLWLSPYDSSSSENWFDKIHKQAHTTPKEWCHFDIRYGTVFTFSAVIPEEIKVISCKEDMNSFIREFGEPELRQCRSHLPGESKCRGNGVTECSYCFGLHIEWTRVRQNYQGIAIVPFEWNLSNISGKPEYHWNAFDCASWCFWDTAYLRQTGFLIDVGESRQIVPNSELGSPCGRCLTRISV